MQIASRINMNNTSAKVAIMTTGIGAIAAGVTLKIILRGAKMTQNTYSERQRDERVGERKEKPFVFK